MNPDPPNDPTCTIKTGESVTILQDGFRLPDGTTVTSIDNCTFESEASVVVEMSDEASPVAAPEPETPTTLANPDTATVPEDPTPTHVALPRAHTPTTVDEVVGVVETVTPTADEPQAIVGLTEPPPGPPVPPEGMSIPVMAAVVAAVAATAVGATVLSNAAKTKRPNRRKGKEQKRGKESDHKQSKEEREREQKECTTKSDRVSNKIQDLVVMAEQSRTAKLKVRDPERLYAEIEETELEVAALNRMVKRRRRKPAE